MNAAAATKYSKPKRGTAACFVRMATYHVRQYRNEMALLCNESFIFFNSSVREELSMKFFKLLLITIALGFVMVSGKTSSAAASSATQTVAGGGVTVKATFLNPKDAADPRFQVVLDTHSVNLDTYDLKSIAVLRDDTEKTYVPTAIENKGGGHHREAVVTFAKLAPEAKRIELIIRDVAGVKERTFVWKLDQ
jgi:hypothetical protein